MGAGAYWESSCWGSLPARRAEAAVGAGKQSCSRPAAWSRSVAEAPEGAVCRTLARGPRCRDKNCPVLTEVGEGPAFSEPGSAGAEVTEGGGLIPELWKSWPPPASSAEEMPQLRPRWGSRRQARGSGLKLCPAGGGGSCRGRPWDSA